MSMCSAVGRAEPTQAVRRAFLRAFERPRVPLEPLLIGTGTTGELTRERLTIASEAGVRVPVLLIRRRDVVGCLPAVVCLHGLGGSKDDMAGYLEELARRGFIGVAIDARYHGDRAGNLTDAMARAYRLGDQHPYLWDTAWDAWRVMDYLQTRADVDRDRLGCMGISLGGHTTWMVSADPRVKAAVPIISVCSWRWQLRARGYQQRVSNLQPAYDFVRDALGEKEVNPKVVATAWDRWMPGIPSRYDCQDILGAMAPRALLILGGDSDPVAPIEGVREAYSVIEAAYAKAHAKERLKMIIAEHSGHTVTAEHTAAMYAWFEQWLKPKRP